MLVIDNPEIAECSLPTEFGQFRLRLFVNPADQSHNVALVKGRVDGDEAVLARIHSECLTGEVFSSQRCDCRHQLLSALGAIAEHGTGVLLYLRQEGRGIGLANKIRAYGLQEAGLDTFEANLALGLPADSRDYHFAGVMFRSLGVRSVRLMTNNPEKAAALGELGIEVVEQIRMSGGRTPHNTAYLSAKVRVTGHDPALLV
jgi:GTP cyclohydrolase II